MNKKIVLGGGCFWGVEGYFKEINGVVNTRVGYSNGSADSPTYKDVCSGGTGHAEVCKLEYDSEVISLEKILKHFFRIIDPTSLNKQGNDRGTQYRSGIYYNSLEEKEIIDTFIDSKRDNYDKPIVVEVLPLSNYHDAEEYHQNYLGKNPGGYCHIDLNMAKVDVE